MSVIRTLLSGFTSTGPGAAQQIDPGLYHRGFVASMTGTGALTATVVVEVSIDGVIWAPRMTFTLSGTNTAVGQDSDMTQSFPYVRGNVTALTGTGAAVSLSACAA